MRISFKVFCLIVLSVSCSAVAQIALKHGVASSAVGAVSSNKMLQSLMTVLGNRFVVAGLALYAIGALVWLAVLAHIDVSQAYPFVGLGFILTMLLGAIVLGEAVSPVRVGGTALVIVGVFLIARS